MSLLISISISFFAIKPFSLSSRYDDFYFLTDPEDFINSHCPDEQEWQLLDDPIPLEEFEKRVLKTSEFYRLGLTLLHPKHFLLVTGQSRIHIKPKWRHSP